MKTALLIICGCTLILLGCVGWIDCIVWNSQDHVWIPSCTGNGGRWGSREYWDHTAPDGWYHVSGIDASENGQIFFPMCPSCGSRLHGVWETKVLLPEGFEGDVRLVNNVIVEVEE